MVSPGSRPYNRAYIQSDKFDTLEFIRITRSLPFGSLNICLNQHLDEVKEELGQLVNNEFSQFISLYGQIGETGNQELAALSESLVTLHGKIGGLVKEVNEEHSQFKSAMEELKETQRTEVLLRLEGHFINSMEEMEEFYEARDWSLCALYLTRWPRESPLHAKFFQSQPTLLQKYESITEKTLKGLEEDSKRFFAQDNVTEAIVLASSYQLMGKFQTFKTLFIETITRSFCAVEVSQKRLEELLKSTSNKPGLVRLYDNVVEFMDKCSQTWISPLKEIFPEEHSLALTLLIEPIFDRILTDMTVIFSPGVPDAFQHAYVASQNFLSQGMEIFKSEESRIKSSAIYKTFQKSWQINIYYQLRFRDIATLMEESLDIQLPIISFSSGKAKLELDQIYQFKTLKQSLQMIWSDHILLDPLFTKFFKFTLQTFSRYIDWMVSLPADIKGTELGLSNLIAKAYQLWSAKEYFRHFFKSKIVPMSLERKVDTTLLSTIIDRFYASKIQDAVAYIEESLVSYSTSFARALVASEKELNSTKVLNFFDSFSSVISFTDPQYSSSALASCVKMMASSLADRFETSSKAATNVKRLQTVMKTPISPEDQDKLVYHDNLVLFIRVVTEGLGKKHDSSELKALKDRIN